MKRKTLDRIGCGVLAVGAIVFGWLRAPDADALPVFAAYEPDIVQEIQKDARYEQVESYTDEDLELLALVIYQEAGGDACSDDTRLKVGTVVMNRVADHRFPDSIREVITERAQYGTLHWTGPEWPERANNEAEAHAVARAYDCAEQVLQGYRALPADTVYQAEFEQGDEVVAHQDGFYFCRWEVKA